jgi:leader peptidase (prepilin peptidase) / N-methyltransferase
LSGYGRPSQSGKSPEEFQAFSSAAPAQRVARNCHTAALSCYVQRPHFGGEEDWALNPSIWLCALAPILGSFLGTIVIRQDQLASVMLGRSACDHCRRPLQAWDLVPVISWAVLGGRCRYCGGKLGLFYPLMELTAFGVALWAAMVFSGWMLLASCALGLVLLTLAATDLKYFRLPDFLTLPLIAAGLLANSAISQDRLVDCVLGSLAGLLFVLILRAVYFRLRGREGIGLGDAKLLAASGAWVAWAGLPSVLLIASLSGLGFALISRLPSLTFSDRIPFGAFLCAGTWLVWLYGPLMPR